MVETFADIGGGYSEWFINRAINNPGQQFVVIEPDPRVKPKELPKNCRWIVSEITQKAKLPLISNSVDEVNFNFVFLDLLGEHKEHLTSELIREGLRILKPGQNLFFPKFLYIRDTITTHKDLLEPALQSMGIPFRAKPILPGQAISMSLAVQEAMKEYQDGDKKMQPYLITLDKVAK